MDIQEIVGDFLNSSHGQNAVTALGNQGIGADDAQTYLTHATAAAVDHVQAHHESHGLLGDYAGKSFFASFAAGMIKGDGVIGALEDGGMGVVSGRIAEALSEKAGLDGPTASIVSAAVTPYVTAYLKQRFA